MPEMLLLEKVRLQKNNHILMLCTMGTVGLGITTGFLDLVSTQKVLIQIDFHLIPNLFGKGYFIYSTKFAHFMSKR